MGYKISIYACVTHSFESAREWSYRPTQTDLSDHSCRIFVVFVNRRCLSIFLIYIGIRRKVSEISGICLFPVSHLNHELTQAAYELRV